MSALPTRIESQANRSLTAGEIFEITRAREKSLSRLLILFITTGLAFMLLPGTFLGVWNLLAISSHRAASSVSAGWVAPQFAFRAGLSAITAPVLRSVYESNVGFRSPPGWGWAPSDGGSGRVRPESRNASYCPNRYGIVS